MDRMQLVALTVDGPDADPAEVHFGQKLTVIHGASDTGKSYIYDAIAYSLGASSLRDIDESAAYESLSLSMRTRSYPDIVTFKRSLRDSAARARATARGLEGDSFTLSVRHTNSNRNNISNFLLHEIGLGDRWVRTNDRNETQPLSFTDVRLLALVGETKIVNEAASPFSGQHASRTRERSVLKIFLEGEDDSDLPRFSRANVAKQQQDAGRLAALEQIAQGIRFNQAGGETESELIDRGRRLQEAAEAMATAMGQFVAQRASIVQAHSELASQVSASRSRRAEIEDLVSNFALLFRKYASDVERLDMLEEAGALLGYFETGDCVFCGATAEHQTAPAHEISNHSAFAEAVFAEKSKTQTLQADLELTISDLANEIILVESQIDQSQRQMLQLEIRLRSLEEQLAPRQQDLRQLIDARAQVERKLAAYEQLRDIDALRAAVAVPPAAPVPVASSISRRTESAFAAVVEDVLRAWRLPELRTVDFDSTSGEVIVNGVPRGIRGKGMRAVLHAAFTVGLAQWCIEVGRPHPGFVVLDSPLLTYKQPKTAEDIALAHSGVAERFYQFLESDFAGQAVVLENVPPVGDLDGASRSYEFTKRNDGRYGFFPPSASWQKPS